MAPRVLPCNFKNNIVLSKSCLAEIEKIHHDFAIDASEEISSLLHEAVAISIAPPEQIPLSLFLKTCSQQAAYAILNMGPFAKSALLTICPRLSYNIVNRLLGEETGSLFYAHPLSQLQLAVLRQFINTFLKALPKAWQHYFNISTHVSELGASLAKIKPLHKSTKYTAVTFKIEFSQQIGFISLLYPSESLVSMQNDLPHQQHTGHKINTEEIELSLKAILGSSILPYRNLMQLKIGDILKLEQPLSAPSKLYIEGIPFLQGYPGLLYKNRGFILTKP